MRIPRFLRRLLGAGPPRQEQERGACRHQIPCKEALSVLHEYLDRELTGDEHDRVKAHFDICGRCYPRLRTEESFRLAVRKAARGQTAPEGLRQRLRATLARIESEGPEREESSKRGR